MTDKQFKLTPHRLKRLVDDFRVCQSTDRITVFGRSVGFMERRAPLSAVDSGWHFRADDESEAYVNDPSNWGLYHVNTIANYDADIIPFLEAPVGSAFERGSSGSFQPASGVRLVYSADVEAGVAPLVEGLRAGMTDTSIEVVFVPSSANADTEAVGVLAEVLREASKGLIRLMELSPGAETMIDAAVEPGALVDLLLANLEVEVELKAAFRAMANVEERLARLIPIIARQEEIVEMRAHFSPTFLDEALRAEIAEHGMPDTSEGQRKMVLALQQNALLADLAATGVGVDMKDPYAWVKAELTNDLLVHLPIDLTGVTGEAACRKRARKQLTLLRGKLRKEVRLQQLKVIIEELNE